MRFHVHDNAYTIAFNSSETLCQNYSPDFLYHVYCPCIELTPLLGETYK